MAASFLAAAIVCVAILFIGQAALRICGAKRWSWVAPPVGLSIAMLAGVPEYHYPGRAEATAIVGLALTVMAMVWCLSSRAHRPPISGLLAVVPIALLLPIPFVAAGHAGILGVSLDNDMTSHLIWAEAYVSRAVSANAPLPPEYPLGPHSVAAALSRGTGIALIPAFTGLTMALPLANGWTALAFLRRAGWLGKAITATVVGLPFMVTAYYGESSFKEVLMAGLMIAVAAYLAEYAELGMRRSLRWVPLALIGGGVASAYSLPGLVWPAAAIGAWLAITGFLLFRRAGFAGLRRAALENVVPVLVAGGVFVVALLPQAKRLDYFLSQGEAAFGLQQSGLGNLIRPLSGWQAFGVWPNADFRLAPPPFFFGGIWVGAAVLLVLLGAAWAIRQQRWPVLAGAIGAFVIWAYAAIARAPYQTAKALVILSPMLLALAVLPLVDAEKRRRGRLPALATIVALGLAVSVVVSDLGALRFSPVGPTDHIVELESLRAQIGVGETLFFGDDDFYRWELGGVPARAAIYANHKVLRLQRGKDWYPGEPLDLDSVDPETLNRFEWMVTPRDSAGSAPPKGIRLAATTPNYKLWRRVEVLGPRSILREQQFAGAILRCDKPSGRRALAGGGVAAIRPEPVETLVPTTRAGSTGATRMKLPAGQWSLTLQYKSLVPIHVRVADLRRTMPPTLDRLGTRWPLGRIEVPELTKVEVEVEVDKPLLTAPTTFAEMGRLVATRSGGRRIVPIAQACGKYVDWYRPAGA